jgi:hypothetical protein
MQECRCRQPADPCPDHRYAPRLHGPKRQHLCEKVNSNVWNS